MPKSKSSNHLVPSALADPTMYFSCIVFLPLVVLTMACPFQVPCNCGLGSGENPCTGGGGHQCQPLVVRPVEIPKPLLPSPVPKVICKTIPGVPPLLPIPGPCSCQSAIVKPATVPKPACKLCQASYSQQNAYANQRQDVLIGGCGGGPAPLPMVYDDMMLPSPANPAAYMPADAVSIAIAQKLAQEACLHAEDKLSFGFRKLPKEMPQVFAKRVNNIKEENLFDMNGAIVELKPIACASPKSLAEEAAEELLDISEEEALEVAAPFKKISLGEIGYGPAKIKPAPFVDVPLSPVALLEEKIVDNRPVYCNDGFKPGNVIFAHAPKPESLVLPPPMPEPCSSEEYMPPLPVLPPAPKPMPMPFYLQQSSSSAASYANKMSNVLIQKLSGCGL